MSALRATFLTGYNRDSKAEHIDRHEAGLQAVAAGAIEAARDAIMPPLNWNLLHDGNEAPGTDVVDGVYHDVHRELSEQADRARGIFPAEPSAATESEGI